MAAKDRFYCILKDEDGSKRKSKKKEKTKEKEVKDGVKKEKKMKTKVEEEEDDDMDAFEKFLADDKVKDNGGAGYESLW